MSKSNEMQPKKPATTIRTCPNMLALEILTRFILEAAERILFMAEILTNNGAREMRGVSDIDQPHLRQKHSHDENPQAIIKKDPKK